MLVLSPALLVKEKCKFKKKKKKRKRGGGLTFWEKNNIFPRTNPTNLNRAFLFFLTESMWHTSPNLKFFLSHHLLLLNVSRLQCIIKTCSYVKALNFHLRSSEPSDTSWNASASEDRKNAVFFFYLFQNHSYVLGKVAPVCIHVFSSSVEAWKLSQRPDYHPCTKTGCGKLGNISKQAKWLTCNGVKLFSKPSRT